MRTSARQPQQRVVSGKMYRSLNNQQKKRNRRAPRAQAGGFGDTWCLLAATVGCRGLDACASPASPRPPAAGSAAARSAACQRLGGWASSGAGRGSGRGGGSGSGKRRGFAGCPVATQGGGQVKGRARSLPARPQPPRSPERWTAAILRPAVRLVRSSGRRGRGAEGVAARTCMAAPCFMKTSWFAA